MGRMIFAFAVGFAGGAWHLSATAMRARAFASGSFLASMVLLPVALLGPVGAVLIAMQSSPSSVWAVLPGLIVARLSLLRPLEARLVEDG